MNLLKSENVAFLPGGGSGMNREDALCSRERDFWTELEDGYGFVRPDIVKSASESGSRKRHEHIKEAIFDFLKKRADALADGDAKRLSVPDCFDREMWFDVEFIIAFDTSFTYTAYEDGEEDGDVAFEESQCERQDYLDDESTFRYDVITLCDKLALQGAALARRIGSDTYGMWTAAMIKLASEDNHVQHTAVDDIMNALQQIWADLRVWILMNPLHDKNKCGKKPGKRKK